MGKQITMATKEDAPTALDKLKKLREQTAKLEAEVKDSLLSQASQAVKELEELGFTYHLLTEEEYTTLKTPAFVLSSAPAKKAGRPPASTPKAKVVGESAKYDPSKSCAKCNGMAGHGSKAHNLAEGFKDKAFTEVELKTRGYWPPTGQVATA